MKTAKIGAILSLALILTGFSPASCSASPKADPNCGLRPTDWCASKPDDPCGAHPDEKSCRADPKCKGLPYRGESLERCKEDGQGFWSNCPAVGCVSR